MSESRKIVRLRARGKGFEEAWAGKGISVQGTAARDSDLAVLVPEDVVSAPGVVIPEVVGRCEGGVFHPIYRTRGL